MDCFLRVVEIIVSLAGIFSIFYEYRLRNDIPIYEIRVTCIICGQTATPLHPERP
jgi:hypothetical protein